MLNTEKEFIKKELAPCQSVEDIFLRLGALYDLKNAKLGSISKPLFIEGVIKGISLVKPKMK